MKLRDVQSWPTLESFSGLPIGIGSVGKKGDVEAVGESEDVGSSSCVTV